MIWLRQFLYLFFSSKAEKGTSQCNLRNFSLFLISMNDDRLCNKLHSVIYTDYTVTVIAAPKSFLYRNVPISLSLLTWFSHNVVKKLPIVLKYNKPLTFCAEFLRLLRLKWGAPEFGWSGTAGSGWTLCTGLVGFVADFFKVAMRFSHISDTSSIRRRTWIRGTSWKIQKTFKKKKEITFLVTKIHKSRAMKNVHLKEVLIRTESYGQ